MNAIQQLDDALQLRNKETNEFLEEIIAIINESIDNLPFCTRANSTPEVEGSVKILRRDLDAIISRIKDDRNIDAHAAEALVSRLKFTNVKKMPSGLTPRPSEDRLSQLDFSEHSPSGGSNEPVHFGGKRSTRTRRR